MILNIIFINSALILACFLLSLALFPFSLRVSSKIGAIDLPSARKIHTRPTARAGGIGFFASFSAFISLAQLDSPSFQLSFLIGGAIIFLVGLFDDVRGLSPFQKIAGQIAAASVPVFFGMTSYSGVASYATVLWSAVSVLWILFLTNAINLSDGVDGLAAGSSVSFALTLALFAFIIPESDVFWSALMLGASLLGFLPHNKHPARIFMGDCGSLFIGYSLSLLSLRWFSLSPSVLNALAVILLFFVPVSDTLQSFFRRIRRGKSPFAADKEHLHHKLLSHGFSPQCTSLAMITISAFFEFVAVLLLN